MLKSSKKIKDIFIVILIAIMCGIIFFYQTKKVGFHEDEMYTIASSVNPDNGLMWAYDDNNNLEWKTREYVRDYVTLTPNNYLNLKSVYINQYGNTLRERYGGYFYEESNSDRAAVCGGRADGVPVRDCGRGGTFPNGGVPARTYPRELQRRGRSGGQIRSARRRGGIPHARGGGVRNEGGGNRRHRGAPRRDRDRGGAHSRRERLRLRRAGERAEGGIPDPRVRRRDPARGRVRRAHSRTRHGGGG